MLLQELTEWATNEKVIIIGTTKAEETKVKIKEETEKIVPVVPTMKEPEYESDEKVLKRIKKLKL